MDTEYDVSVIIPCFNEENNIEKCIRRIPKLPWSYEIIVVNDGSIDKTYSVAKKVKIKNLTVVGYNKNRGKGFAVRYGIENSKGKIGVIQDADMATPPEDIKKIVEPIIENKADFVNGSRMIFSRESGSMKGVHVIGNKFFAFIISFLVRKKLTDTLCGFKAFRIAEFRGKLKEDTWPDFEMLLKARKFKMRIHEVPIHYKKRVAGKSKMRSFKHAIDMTKVLLKSIYN